MPVDITVPKFGLTMTEAKIVQWCKQEGDAVRKGEILFVLETEKVSYEVESSENGTLGKILFAEQTTVAVGVVVALLLREGEQLPEPDAGAVDKKPAAGATPGQHPKPKAAAGADTAQAPRSFSGKRIKASPSARKAARMLKVDLRQVAGSGPGGSIVRADVEKAAATAAGAAPPAETPQADGRLVAFTGMRQTIAKKMLASKTTTAQTYMTNAVDAGPLVAYRKKVLAPIQQAHGVRVTITDILMKITGEAIKAHPVINTCWREDGIMFMEKIHMGMAMALEDGLIVPVIEDITQKDLAQVALDRQALVDMGRKRTFLLEDISGSTFTLSTLGMFGVDQFTANINLPENAILAVGAISDKPVAINAQVVIRPMMNITLSYDHRVIDGADAARFMRTLKAFIQDPAAVLDRPLRAAVTAQNRRVTVIGGGVGGYSAAIVAARLGATVTLVEKDHLGGVCLNRGCIPTKAMLHAGEVLGTVEEASTFGVNCSDVGFDFARIMARKQAVVGRLRNGVKSLLAAKKVRVVDASARLIDPTTIEIAGSGETIATDAVIIATGSAPRPLAVSGADVPDVLNSNDFLSMKRLPKSVTIIGGGYIGVEFAQILNRLKVAVTILEFMDHLVPGVDTEIASILEKSLIKSGIKVFTGARVEGIDHGRGKCTVHFLTGTEKKTCVSEKVVASVGRKPDLSWLDMDRLGLAQAKGALFVNTQMATNLCGVYAVGDVVGGIMLAHVAAAEGECAAQNIMGSKRTINYQAVPSCIYTSPEVAAVGLTEAEARKKTDIQVGRFPFTACGKAMILNRTEGMVKIVADAGSGAVLGVHIIGAHATDMIAEAVLGISLNMTVAQLAHSIHPHPSLSESIMESALTLCGGAIHIP